MSTHELRSTSSETTNAFTPAVTTQSDKREAQPAEQALDQPAAQNDQSAATPQDVSRVVSHFAEPDAYRFPTLDPSFIGPPTKQMLLAAEKQRLQTEMTTAQALTGDQRAQSIERALAQTEQFSSHYYGNQKDRDGKQVRQAVPPELISTIRPLITDIERPVDGQTLPEGVDPESSRIGTNEDWNSRLGVPQYRTQSDNLATPEGTCNVTSLAMIFERLGYSREDAMRAVERRLKKQYLAQKNKGKDVCTIERPEDLDNFKLPDEVFQRAVKGYLDTQQRAGSKYQRLRGENTTNDERLEMSREFKDSAQYEDVLDMLRHVSNAGERTNMGTVAPKLLAEIEPDEIRRPKIETVDSSWSGAREKLQESLDLGGGAQLSFNHKGRGRDGSHIVSVQDVLSDGLRIDDPYGDPRDSYSKRTPGDAYAPAKSTQRTAEYQNQKDSTEGDWKTDRAQNLTPGESLGDSTTVPDSVYENSWRYARIFTPKTQAEIEKAEDEKYHRYGSLLLPK